MVGGTRKKSGIVIIFKKYKDIFDHIMNNLNTKSSDCPGLINKETCIAPGIGNS